MAFKERQHYIIKRIGRCDSCFLSIELGKSDAAIGIHEGLLVNPAYAFDCANVIGVL